MAFFIYLFFTGIFAGLIGSVIGIGGGIIIVPVLTLVLKVPIHLAIGTSIISVMVTSLSASIRFFKRDIINIPMGLTLEIPTTIGGIIGSLAVSYLKNNVLFIIFGGFALLSGIFTFVKNKLSVFPGGSTEATTQNEQIDLEINENVLKAAGQGAENSIFDSRYYDEASHQSIKYRVRRAPLGGSLSFFAGALSGLLGVGGGVIKVPVMNVIMNVPIKVATATSTYMIGITAVVSSIIYFYNGYINPFITVAVITGVLIGATSGSYVAVKLKSRQMAIIILSVFTVIGIFMFLRAFDILVY